MTPGSASSDDSGDDEVEDITYTGASSSHNHAASSSQPSYNENWRNFDDDPYNSVDEMARGMLIQPPTNDDSDDDDEDSDDDDDEPRLW